MINDIFDEIIEYCNRRTNCTRYDDCPFFDDECNRCLFKVSPNFWNIDKIRNAIQKMREDNVNRLKEEKEKK